MKTTPIRRDAAERLARLLHILTTLRVKPEGVPVRAVQLEHPFLYSRRTLYRELHFLEQEGYLCWKRSEGVLLTPQGALMPHAPWNAEDTIAFAIAQLCLAHSDLANQPALQTAFAKITGTLSPGLNRLMKEALRASAAFPPPVAANPNPIPSDAFSNLQTILKAIQNRHTLQMEYDSPGSGCASRLLDPYHLEMQNSERILLHGWCHRREELRAFRVRRIQRMQTTGHAFRWRDDLWDAYQKQDGIFQGLRGGLPIAVRVRFAPEVVRYAQEHGWPAGVQFQSSSDGTAFLMGTVQGVDGILVELLRWRRHIYLEGGPELRRAYLAELNAMLDLYEK